MDSGNDLFIFLFLLAAERPSSAESLPWDFCSNGLFPRASQHAREHFFSVRALQLNSGVPDARSAVGTRASAGVAAFCHDPLEAMVSQPS